MKIIRYIFSSKKDLILLLTVIAFIIKDYDKFNPLVVFAVYIIVSMISNGREFDKLNYGVTVPEYRRAMKLPPIPGDPIRKSRSSRILQAIFVLVWTGILIYFIFDK